MQSQFHPALVPDPFKPIVPARLSMQAGGAAQNRSQDRQRLRRSAMLAVTRRLLAEGQDQFTLRRLSEECGVTVQTIRNSFGRREDLLVSSLNEHTSAIWHALASFSSGPALFLDLAQMYYHCAIATPAFLRAMVTTAVTGNQNLAVLQRHGAAIKIGHLRSMTRQGALRPGANIEELAAQITRLNTFMMYEWAASGDAGELRRQMVAGNKMLLAGAMDVSGVATLEAWVPCQAG